MGGWVWEEERELKNGEGIMKMEITGSPWLTYSATIGLKSSLVYQS